MLSFSDSRAVGTLEERLAQCLYCGRSLVVLPDDRREGSCFDCLSLSVPAPSPCPECEAWIQGDDRALGCSECGWYPLRG